MAAAFQRKRAGPTRIEGAWVNVKSPAASLTHATNGCQSGVGLLLAEALERQLDFELVARPDVDDFAPMRIVQAFGVETDEAPDQPAQKRRPDAASIVMFTKPKKVRQVRACAASPV